MHLFRFCCVFVLLGPFSSGCGGSSGSDAEPFVPEAFGQWLKFEPDGAVCANGTQYKYFASFSETSDNLVVIFEGGGGCMDYQSCTSADPSFEPNPANTDCLKDPGSTCVRDDYATAWIDVDVPEALAESAEQFGIIDGNVPIDFAFPVLSTDPAVNPMADWNKVFLPYCTADMHFGNTVRTYSDPTGQGPDVEFHHKGFENTLRVTEELDRMFPRVPKMMVSGCSSGGFAAMLNYSFVREGMKGVERGYLLADGAPIIPTKLENGEDSHSLPVHMKMREAWNLAPAVARIPGAAPMSQDLGAVNRLTAQAYPDDRLSVSTFSLDYVFAPASYEGFVDFFDFLETNGPETAAGRTEVYRLSSEDLAGLRAEFDTQPNLAYYLPYYRTTFNSHCLTFAPLEEFDSLGAFGAAVLTDPADALWKGTEIEASGTTLQSYVEHLLNDDEELRSYFETECEGRLQVCALDCATYDEELCVAEVTQP